jgi:hypothetical protein
MPDEKVIIALGNPEERSEIPTRNEIFIQEHGHTATAVK